MLTRKLKRWFSHQDKMQAVYSELAHHQWSSGALTQYFTQPLPNTQSPLTELEFVAIDFETTGLEPESNRILSIGSISLNYEEIDLTSMNEVYLRNEDFVRPESAVVNEIMPKQVIQQGVDSSSAIDQLLDRVAGKVIIAHSASIEYGFLLAYLSRQYNLDALPCYLIDTLALEKRFSYLGQNHGHNSFQLDDLREHYNLPEYNAHSAASDALGCAELFLAQVKRLKLCHRPLKEVLYRPF
ncbi:exonuclease domain-containing protein [Vibrio hippocampi]|nr:exonuclease domain-containing protein [Vibrio hippocampi]